MRIFGMHGTVNDKKGAVWWQERLRKLNEKILQGKIRTERKVKKTEHKTENGQIKNSVRRKRKGEREKGGYSEWYGWPVKERKRVDEDDGWTDEKGETSERTEGRWGRGHLCKHEVEMCFFALWEFTFSGWHAALLFLYFFTPVWIKVSSHHSASVTVIAV